MAWSHLHAILLCLAVGGGVAAANGDFTASGDHQRNLLMEISPDLPPKSMEGQKYGNNRGPTLREDISLLDTAAGFAPEQVHLTYWGTPDKMLVSFASANGALIMGEPPAAPQAASTAVAQWGTSQGDMKNSADCATTAYVQNQYAYKKSPSYISPYLSHCLMTGLPAGTQIFYRVGWPEFDEWSRTFNFTTFKATGNFPLKIGVMADLGLSYNASDTVNGIYNNKPQVVLNVGDLPYADNFMPNGHEGTVKGLKYFLSYQPRWDMYGRMLERLSQSVPVMTSTGNHEVEFQPDGTVFAAYNSRYPVPQDPSRGPNLALNTFSKANPSPDNGLYYSWDVPGTAHFIALTSYITNDTFGTDTKQYKWFEADLKKVDRSKTPWLIVYMHAPIVSSYEAAFKQVECMRLTYEPLMYKYGVDIVINGHVHAYERSKPVYNYTLDACGPVHITIGCGGKPGEPGSGLDALDLKYIEQGSWYCDDPKKLDVKPSVVQPLRCHTSQPKLGGFCWNRQPEFSAYREAAFGHSLLTLLNATHAEFRWNRNGGHPNVINDYVMMNRGVPNCKNKVIMAPGSDAVSDAAPAAASAGRRRQRRA